MTEPTEPQIPERSPVPDELDRTLSDDVGDEEPDMEVVESISAIRSSPYAVVAFVLSLVGLTPSLQLSFPIFFPFPSPLGGVELARLLLPALIPIGTAALAIWFAGRGELEIEKSRGRLGGVAFCRAARAAALLTMTSVALSLIMQLVIREPEEMVEFGGDVPEVVDGESEPPPVEFLPPEDVPPIPARPARPVGPD